ncbi:MAG: hypothetical protein VX431_01965 [Planctomycetota bacterium]|nr:hypothetical protein [Planctomycetota bacterium]
MFFRTASRSSSRRHTRAASLAVFVALIACGGCLVPANRIETCQAQYPQLSERNKSLETTLANLEAECRRLRSERDQSEQELVTLDREVPAIFARLDNITQPPVATRTQLIELADESAGIDFDSARGALVLDPDTFFGSGGDLYVESGDTLGALATILAQPELRSHRVLIVMDRDAATPSTPPQTPTYRAEKLAEFFRRWGISAERIGVSNYFASAAAAPNTAEKTSHRTSLGSMKIYLLAEDVPVIGWKTSGHLPRR